jgi:hypothetical protein
VSDLPRIDIRLVGRIRAHLESPEVLAVGVGDEDEVMEFLARLTLEDVEALVGDVLDEGDLDRLLSVLEHRKGLLPADELPPGDARVREERIESLRRAAADRKIHRHPKIGSQDERT